MIKEDVVSHICGINREDTRINSVWLAAHYEDNFRADPNWKLDAFMDAIKRDLNFEITRGWHTKLKLIHRTKCLGIRTSNITE